VQSHLTGRHDRWRYRDRQVISSVYRSIRVVAVGRIQRGEIARLDHDSAIGLHEVRAVLVNGKNMKRVPKAAIGVDEIVRRAIADQQNLFDCVMRNRQDDELVVDDGGNSHRIAAAVEDRPLRMEFDRQGTPPPLHVPPIPD